MSVAQEALRLGLARQVRGLDSSLAMMHTLLEAAPNPDTKSRIEQRIEELESDRIETLTRLEASKP